MGQLKQSDCLSFSACRNHFCWSSTFGPYSTEMIWSDVCNVSFPNTYVRYVRIITYTCIVNTHATFTIIGVLPCYLPGNYMNTPQSCWRVKDSRDRDEQYLKLDEDKYYDYTWQQHDSVLCSLIKHQESHQLLTLLQVISHGHKRHENEQIGSCTSKPFCLIHKFSS